VKLYICEKCGWKLKRDFTPRGCGCGGSFLEVASGAQPPEAVSPSATGCRGATAPSNPEADSSVRCRDKAELAAALEIIRDLRCLVWEHHASTVMRDEHHVCQVCSRKEMASVDKRASDFLKAASAPPCGERARLDNDELCEPPTKNREPRSGTECANGGSQQ
jgi:hypothetical protein